LSPGHFLSLACLALLASCEARSPGTAPAGSGAKASSEPFPQFTDVTVAWGIRFEHQNGFDGQRYRIVETINGGVALLDHDGDGWLDIFFTNGARLDPPPGSKGVRAGDALFRNRGGGTFEDVTARAGVGDERLSLGAASADLDGDGFPEVLVTCLGRNRLWKNRGDGTFLDVAEEAGLTDESMHSGAAFLDMDEDGDLDLYLASYALDRKADQSPCRMLGVPIYCTPQEYPAEPDHLYRNDGGRFTDVSEASGIRQVEPGRGLSVVAADFDGDGHQDLYVANDTTANFLFLGDGRGRFREVGLQSGCALGEDATEGGSMGIEAADYDGDGVLDILVTNYQNQINNLFRAVRGGDLYEDRARFAGICQGRMPEVAWGAGLPDLDQDGLRDLLVVNGHLNHLAHEADEETSYQQRSRVFRNVGGGKFEERSEGAGEAFRTPRVGRGTAFGDLDNDGDLDVVIVNSSGPPSVLRNDGGNRGRFALIHLVGDGLNRNAIGARVTVAAGDRRQVAERRSSGSYLSVNDPRLHFGLGKSARMDRLEVRWPDGKVEVHRDLPADRLITVTKGSTACRIEDLPKYSATQKSEH